MILDVKGAIFETPSHHRQSIGNEIFRFAPFDFDNSSPSFALLIPKRQNPFWVKLIIYFEDPTFLALFKAQKWPLPYPSKHLVKIADFEFRLAALENQATSVVTMAYQDEGPWLWPWKARRMSGKS